MFNLDNGISEEAVIQSDLFLDNGLLGLGSDGSFVLSGIAGHLPRANHTLFRVNRWGGSACID